MLLKCHTITHVGPIPSIWNFVWA